MAIIYGDGVDSEMNKFREAGITKIRKARATMSTEAATLSFLCVLPQRKCKDPSFHSEQDVKTIM